MKFVHTVKFPLGKRYEMREFSMEMEDTDFPELKHCTVIERTRYLQGTLLQMGLVFQAASGYVSPDSSDFKEQMRLALELKALPPKSRKVPSTTPSFSDSPIPEKGKK